MECDSDGNPRLDVVGFLSFLADPVGTSSASATPRSPTP
ncbi:hypothetical protein SUDANB140_05039 [Streptomyces sp. enrichment culture]